MLVRDGTVVAVRVAAVVAPRGGSLDHFGEEVCGARHLKRVPRVIEKVHHLVHQQRQVRLLARPVDDAFAAAIVAVVVVSPKRLEVVEDDEWLGRVRRAVAQRLHLAHDGGCHGGAVAQRERDSEDRRVRQRREATVAAPAERPERREERDGADSEEQQARAYSLEAHAVSGCGCISPPLFFSIALKKNSVVTYHKGCVRCTEAPV